MTRFVLLALSALVVVAVVSVDTHPIGVVPLPDGRIIGGHEADIRQYPHQVSMRLNGSHRCGGSIYSSNVIVSAAHCVTGVDASLLTIVAGSTLLSEKAAELPVIKYIMHSMYGTYNSDYDLAILVLRGHFQFNDHVQPIALATERAGKGTEVTVTGWGTLVEDGDIPNHLQAVNVNIVDNADCKRAYSSLLTERMLCAGVAQGGKDACQFDSGGPLIVGKKLLGVVSWGMGCGRRDFPGIYVSVPDLHDWIEETAKANAIGLA